jgi:NADH:ubiquinone oxidoreductase subunit 5 (subunit L)/multisubunit Na+/H+ antiporter MnhA subunit
VVDLIVNAVGWTTLVLSRVYAWIDKWIVDGLVNLVGIITRLFGNSFRFLQTGVSQQYILILILSILAIGGLYFMGKF